MTRVNIGASKKTGLLIYQELKKLPKTICFPSPKLQRQESSVEEPVSGRNKATEGNPPRAFRLI